MPIVPFAKWEPVPSHSGAMSAHQGLVLHVQVGNGDCFSEFDVPANNASSTWWVSKTGQLVQYVDSDLTAWAEGAGNSTWNSVETEGYPNEPLTNAQMLTLARLYAWGVNTYHWPLKTAETPSDTGFGWHGMGGVPWGNHPNCPGDIRKNQRANILYLASLTLNPPVPAPSAQETDMLTSTPSGNGYWICKTDGAVFAYGDAQFFGGCNPGGAAPFPAGVTALSIEAHPGGQGYWILSSTHQIYAFGAAGYHGAPSS